MAAGIVLPAGFWAVNLWNYTYVVVMRDKPSSTLCDSLPMVYVCLYNVCTVLRWKLLRKLLMPQPQSWKLPTLQYFLKYLTDVLEWSCTMLVRKFQQNKMKVYCMTDLLGLALSSFVCFSHIIFFTPSAVNSLWRSSLSAGQWSKMPNLAFVVTTV